MSSVRLDKVHRRDSEISAVFSFGRWPTSPLGKKPGNLGEKVENVTDSDLYSSPLTAIIRGYAAING
jgi:hypothetical protein